jgi:arsenate reductase (thioredoxin)
MVLVLGLAACPSLLTPAWNVLPMTACSGNEPASVTLRPDVTHYIAARHAEWELIEPPRRAELEQLAEYVARRSNAGQPVRLTFICTHNSRRSHLAQVWAQVAAAHYGLPAVTTYSGGTEVTAFNPRAVAALQRAGLSIVQAGPDINPQYRVSYASDAADLVCFSKKYDDPANPATEYGAVMTCTQADQGCPVVRGCETRIAIAYEDPKIADGRADESATYDARCAQICREMLYMAAQARKQLSSR